MAGRLAGKTALITGTAGGQGREAALLFAAEGARIIGCDLKVDRQDETVAMVMAQGGGMISMAPLDLIDETQVIALMDFAEASYGGFDILYNNASAQRGGPAEHVTLDNWEFTISNEMTNMFLTARHAFQIFKRRGGGVILNTASTAGMVGAATPGNVPVNFAHNTTKAAIIRMTQHLAIEFAYANVRVNAISPGVILTPATDFWLDALGEKAFTDCLLIERIGQVEDVARAALFLVSDEASYITGINLPVDGGWVASGGLGRPDPAMQDRFASIIERYRNAAAQATQASDQS